MPILHNLYKSTERKILYDGWTPSDGKSSHGPWPGELKIIHVIKNLYLKDMNNSVYKSFGRDVN
jgi:hypothetical protein